MRLLKIVLNEYSNQSSQNGVTRVLVRASVIFERTLFQIKKTFLVHITSAKQSSIKTAEELKCEN